MDFFEQQEKARRNTGLLILLFVLAVLSLVVLTNLAVELSLIMAEAIEAPYDPTRSVLISVFVVLVVGLVSLFKWLQLKRGGRYVAESLGGERVSADTNDPDERRLLNVVEEMAIASNMPVPPVYVLKNEVGINAFAAGHTPADAVVGFTKGAIQRFNRDQLQGVAAHEFSHIFNGDMRMNLRLMAVLHGIVFIRATGGFILRGTSSRTRIRSRGNNGSGGGAIVFFGLALYLIGALGGVFGSLIRSLVSQQREFLADASAVQFTRNPAGIAEALKVIGGHGLGSGIREVEAEEVSHFFFGKTLNSMSGWFSTHPPLSERIERIEPHWDGEFIAPSEEELAQHVADTKAHEEGMREKKQQQKQFVAAAVLSQLQSGVVPDAASTIEHIPQGIVQKTRIPANARVLVFSLFLSFDHEVRKVQLDQLIRNCGEGVRADLYATMEELRDIPMALRMPILQLTFSALREQSAEDYKEFKHTLLLLAKSDGKVDLYEWCMYQLMVYFLDPAFGVSRLNKPKFKQAGDVAEFYQRVLSLLAYQGHEDADKAKSAFNRGASVAGLYNLQMLSEDSCELDSFKQAVYQLARCYPMLKVRLINGLLKAVEHDGKVTLAERDIILAIAAAMDAPLANAKILQKLLITE